MSTHFTVRDVRNGVYRDVVTGRQLEAYCHGLEFDLAENAAGIYVLDGIGKIGCGGPFLR